MSPVRSFGRAGFLISARHKKRSPKKPGSGSDREPPPIHSLTVLLRRTDSRAGYAGRKSRYAAVVALAVPRQLRGSGAGPGGSMSLFHLCPRAQRYSRIHLRCTRTRFRSRYFTDTALRPHSGHLYSPTSVLRWVETESVDPAANEMFVSHAGRTGETLRKRYKRAVRY